MRHLVRVLVAVTSLLTALFIPSTSALLAGPSHGGGSAAVDSAFVRHAMYDLSMSDFTALTKARTGPDGAAGDTWFDWATDLCSAPLVGNTGRSFDFTEPCRRHDFGYRNAKLLDQRYGSGTYWTKSERRHIDDQFLSDMKHHCKKRRLIDHPTCYAWAHIYFAAVRVAGGP